MRKASYLAFIVLLMVVLGAPSVYAGKHGFFLDLASGSGEAEWDSNADSWDIDSDSFAVGYVYDSDPDSSRVFNYRLNIGLVRHDKEDEFGGTLESTGLYAESIFGFALQRKENFRWWGGPLVRLGFYSGEVDDYDIDVDYGEFGIGVATGINFNAGSAMIAPSIGVRYNIYAGEGDFYGGYSEDYEASATNVFFNLAVLF